MPDSVISVPTLPTLRQRLKTFLFRLPSPTLPLITLILLPALGRFWSYFITCTSLKILD